MPCHAAVVKKNVTISPDMRVEEALKSIKKGKVNAVAVVDDDGKFLGFFSMKVLLKNLIPVSVAMVDGVQIDVKVTAAPGVAKRLENVKAHPVFEVMDRKPHCISPDSPIWEGVSLLTKYGSPLCVIDDNDHFHGFITYDSLVENLEDMHSMDA